MLLVDICNLLNINEIMSFLSMEVVIERYFKWHVIEVTPPNQGIMYYNHINLVTTETKLIK